MSFRESLLLYVVFCLLIASAKSYGSEVPQRNPRNGLAVVIAFPDKNIPLPTDPTLWNRVANLLDFDGDGHWKVGHGGLLLIDKLTGSVDYVDFGRYDERLDLSDGRPENFGVVRTSHTVPDLAFVQKAHFLDGILMNLDSLLIELTEKPLFDGYGRIEAAIYDLLDLSDMWEFIREQETRGYIKYGCPTQQYCTRFARQAIRKGGGRYGLGVYTGRQMVRWHKKNL